MANLIKEENRHLLLEQPSNESGSFIANVNTLAENMHTVHKLANNLDKYAEFVDESIEEAKVWAEGTDDEVSTYGGTHSSKGWSEVSKTHSDSAEASKNTAGTYATNAANSASAADASKIAASNSATAAATSESNASAKATASANSATESQGYANNSATSANESATSASKSYIWAEGTSQQVHDLGGTYSSKDWSKEAEKWAIGDTTARSEGSSKHWSEESQAWAIADITELPEGSSKYWAEQAKYTVSGDTCFIRSEQDTEAGEYSYDIPEEMDESGEAKYIVFYGTDLLNTDDYTIYPLLHTITLEFDPTEELKLTVIAIHMGEVDNFMIPIGTLFTVVGNNNNYVPVGAVSATGGIYSKDLYPALWEYYLNPISPSTTSLLTTCTFDEYEAELTAHPDYCYKWGIDTVATSPTYNQFRVPTVANPSNGKYYVQVATTAYNRTAMDWSAYMSSLDNKVSKTGNETVAGQKTFTTNAKMASSDSSITGQNAVVTMADVAYKDSSDTYHPGIVSTGEQYFSGLKRFNNQVCVEYPSAISTFNALRIGQKKFCVGPDSPELTSGKVYTSSIYGFAYKDAALTQREITFRIRHGVYPGRFGIVILGAYNQDATKLAYISVGCGKDDNGNDYAYAKAPSLYSTSHDENFIVTVSDDADRVVDATTGAITYRPGIIKAGIQHFYGDKITHNDGMGVIGVIRDKFLIGTGSDTVTTETYGGCLQLGACNNAAKTSFASGTQITYSVNTDETGITKISTRHKDGVQRSFLILYSKQDSSGNNISYATCPSYYYHSTGGIITTADAAYADMDASTGLPKTFHPGIVDTGEQVFTGTKIFHKSLIMQTAEHRPLFTQACTDFTTAGTIPTNKCYYGMRFMPYDKRYVYDDMTDAIGGFVGEVNTLGDTHIAIVAKKNELGSNLESAIVCTYPMTGDPYIYAECKSFRPYDDATSATTGTNLGTADYRWANVYAFTGTIQTSDSRQKTDIEAIPDEVLDAWGEVNWKQFKLLASVNSKGDTARIHTGAIAQQIDEVFTSHGLDASKYGLFCHDSWEAKPAEYETEIVEDEPAVYEDYEVIDMPAEYEEVEVEDSPAVYEDVEVIDEPEYTDEDGTVYPAEKHTEHRLVTEAVTHIEQQLVAPEQKHTEKRLVKEAVTHTEQREVTPAREAGDAYSLRYEECLVMEAQYQRRRADRLETKVSSLEARLAAIETYLNNN